MTLHTKISGVGASVVLTAAETAARAIAPVWPLASSVAVNPYLGQTSESLAMVGARLGRVAGLPVTMPQSWYAARIASGRITDADLAGALTSAPQNLRPANLADLKAAALKTNATPQPLPTIADLAAKVSGIDWPGVIAERFGAFAASWFDQGQALWAVPQAKSAFAAWREFAMHDLTPEILGLKGFACHVADTSTAAADASIRAINRLGLTEASMPTYLHQLLMTLGGWSQYARYKLWQAELGASTDATITDFLAIRLIWDEILWENYDAQIGDAWQDAILAHSLPIEATPELIVDQILQEAAERSEQRGLAATLAETSSGVSNARPALQAAFCIDVRSEVFRRALEAVDPHIQTIGFAGFFGLTASHKRFASDVAELRLPVLLNPGVFTCAGGPADDKSDQEARFSARAKRAWGRFKLAAVSSFAFVEAMGPVYAAKLVRDSLGQNQTPMPNDPAPRINPALDLPSRLTAAETVLRAMSMTGPFARVVLMAGHGANVVNNPHASALHCGACGGYSGEVNARLLAALLNDADVRSGLVAKDIVIPADTVFFGALHDTTTDAVHIYAADHVSPAHADDLQKTRDWLAQAGKLTRTERALKLPRAGNEAKIGLRSRDWAEVRPEWALAGCKAFIAAPRSRTKAKNLQGRAFLHDYDWHQDKNFGVLELIMTAPVVVASWISLQYYGSTVAPQFFGSGNKLLHNVAGGIGVVEGNGGPLRTGLPWQSVHDGENYIHDPLRLSVCIEAPCDAMNAILERHDGVRALFDNRWLHLFQMDENGHLAFRYIGDLKWQAMPRVH